MASMDRCVRCKERVGLSEEVVQHEHTGALAHVRCLTDKERAAMASAHLFGKGTGRPKEEQ